jgi:hypothetical protein
MVNAAFSKNNAAICFDRFIRGSPPETPTMDYRNGEGEAGSKGFPSTEVTEEA